MPEFLELLPPTEACKKLLSALPSAKFQIDHIPTVDTLDRVVGETIFAPEPLPAFPRSTVDGYAVLAADTFGSSDTLPAYIQMIGEVPMGSAPSFAIKRGQAALIHTGGMLPEGADAVVMLEYTQASRPGEIEILKAVGVGENILKKGEDVQVGSVILPAGVRLRPVEIGGLLALGLTEVMVVTPPRIGILSSGDEVVPPGQPVQPGQVRDINSYSLSALIQQAGGQPVRYGIVPDRAEILRDILARALAECDAVVITAGSSASTRDLTADVIAQMGQPGVLVHGVNVKPGKPTILGVCDGKAVIGLPGNPVSALVIASLFVTPVIEHLLGLKYSRPKASVPAQLAINLASQAGREDFIPVTLRNTAQGMVAEPIFYKSNLIFSLAKADGLVHIPADATGLAVGALVEVILL